jgi:predicted permease
MNMLLTRFFEQRAEIALFAALGASRLTLFWSSILEAIILGTAGSIFGFLLALYLIPLAQHYLPPNIHFQNNGRIYWSVAPWPLATTILCFITIAAIPAFLSSKTPLQKLLSSLSLFATRSKNEKIIQLFLVTLEISISTSLLFLTICFTMSVTNILVTNPGFDTNHVVSTSLQLPKHLSLNSKDRDSSIRDILKHLSDIPGVKSACITSDLPLMDDQWIDAIRDATDARPPTLIPQEHFRWISPNYFETLHIPLIRGRLLDGRDQGKNFILVSELTARSLWPHIDPIGRTVYRAGFNDTTFTVIGVVGNARTISLSRPDPMMVYIPYWYRSSNTASLLIRTHQEPSTVINSIRRTIWNTAPEAAISSVRLFQDVIVDSVADRYFVIGLLSIFTAASTFLSALGIYSIVNDSVVKQKSEIGVRMAFGARRWHIYKLAVTEIIKPVLFGTIFGICIAFISFRLTESTLYNISFFNPIALILSASMIISISFAASWIPISRIINVASIAQLWRK